MSAPFKLPAVTAGPVWTAEFVATLPPVYSLLPADGVCMEPFIAHGSRLVFSSVEPIEPGDVVAIWWAPGMNAPGSYQVQIKQLVRLPAAGLFVYRLFQPMQTSGGDPAHVLAFHKCLGFRRPDGTCHAIDFGRLIAQLQWVRS